MFPVSTSRTLFCLPQCSSLPVRRESLSSSACVQWLSSLPSRSSYLRSYGRPCFLYELLHELAAGNLVSAEPNQIEIRDHATSNPISASRHLCAPIQRHFTTTRTCPRARRSRLSDRYRLGT